MRPAAIASWPEWYLLDGRVYATEKLEGQWTRVVKLNRLYFQAVTVSDIAELQVVPTLIQQSWSVAEISARAAEPNGWKCIKKVLKQAIEQGHYGKRPVAYCARRAPMRTSLNGRCHTANDGTNHGTGQLHVYGWWKNEKTQTSCTTMMSSINEQCLLFYGKHPRNLEVSRVSCCIGSEPGDQHTLAVDVKRKKKEKSWGP